MVTVLGTLGFHEEKFLPAILATPNVSRVILCYAPGETPEKERKVQLALHRVRRALSGTRAALTEVKLANPWDVSGMLTTFLEELGREGPDNCVFNLTGGTKPMAVAATLACLVTGTKAVYVPEESERPDLIELPLPAIMIRSLLTPSQAKLLRVVAEHEFSSEKDLAEYLRRSAPTVCYHVERLRQVGAISEGGTEDRRIVQPRITKTGEVLLLLHERLRTNARKSGETIRNIPTDR